MNHSATTPRWRTTLWWLLAAVALWLVAATIDRRTEVFIENLGHHLRFVVAGTELVIPDTIQSVERITIFAADSIEPPGGIEIEIDQDGPIEDPPFLRRFPVARDPPAPVGDWWVDNRTELTTVFDHHVALEGDFLIRAVFSGRFTSDLTLRLEGDPTVSFTFRRGLLDNYLVIRSSGGRLLEVTTLDPTPTADLLALGAQLLRGIAAACLVIAFIGLVARFSSRADRVYAATDESAGRLAASRTGHLALVLALVLAAVGTGISAWVAIEVLGGLPHQIDEVVYLLQARWLLDGELAPAAGSIQDHLTVPFTYLIDGRWIGHYPVGWPLLLAAGLLVGAPHLITSVLGFFFVLLVFLIGREIDNGITGLAAASLAVVSPLARILCGSIFPHAACAVLVLLAVWFVLLSRRRESWWFGAGVGAALGCCLAVRPMTAVAVAGVLGGRLLLDALATEKRRNARITIAAATATGLLTSIPTLVHNFVVTGHPLSLPYSLTTGSMYDPNHIAFGIRNLDAILVSTSSSLTGWGWPLATGGLALALPLALVAVPFLLRRARSSDWLLLAVLLIVAIGHLPTRASGLHGYGARYVFDVAGCLYLLMGRGFRDLSRWARPSPVAVTTVAAVFLALNLSALAVLPARLGLYRGYYDVSGQLERDLAATGLDRAVILIDGDLWEPWGEAARLMTGPRRHAIVIAADLEDNTVIETTYPGWPVFRWDGTHLHLEDAGGH